MLGNLDKKVMTDLTIFLPRGNLPRLVRKLASNAINKFKRKVSGRGVMRVGKGFNLFFSNEDGNDIIKIIKSLEDLDVLIDGITERVKYEIKKTRRRISSCNVSSFSRFISVTSDFFSSKR